MQLGLNHILNLYFRDNQNLTINKTAFSDPAYQDKAVDAEQCYENFMGQYAVKFLVKQGESYGQSYLMIAMDFFRKEENKTTPLCNGIIQHALIKQLPFLTEMPPLPKEIFTNFHGGPYLSNTKKMLDWLQEQEGKFGCMHDIEPADKVIPVEDQKVIKLHEIKKNFDKHMFNSGYIIEGPDFS